MRLLLFIIFAVALTCALLLYKISQSLPPKELKRRARGGHDASAAAVYKAVAYGPSFSVLLLIIGGVSATVTLVMLSYISGWLAFGLVLALAWLLLGWQPPKSSKGWPWTISARVAPAVAAILNRAQPVLGRLRVPAKPSSGSAHTGLYEKEDLLELINAQNSQAENRISEAELKIAFGALTFGDKKVSDVMTPLRKVRLVGDSEQIGPLLMDELHATGFSRLPVAKQGTQRSATPEIIGTLYLKDLVGHPESGKVRDVMRKDVFFVNEAQNLRHALDALLKTHHHLFIVVNNFEELVGVLSIEDVLEEILGGQIVDEFDQYSDLRAVAGLEAKAQHAAAHDNSV